MIASFFPNALDFFLPVELRACISFLSCVSICLTMIFANKTLTTLYTCVWFNATMQTQVTTQICFMFKCF